MDFFERCAAAIKENSELYEKGAISLTGYSGVHLTNKAYREMFGVNGDREAAGNYINLSTERGGIKYYALFDYPKDIETIEL